MLVVEVVVVLVVANLVEVVVMVRKSTKMTLTHVKGRVERYFRDGEIGWMMLLLGFVEYVMFAGLLNYFRYPFHYL